MPESVKSKKSKKYTSSHVRNAIRNSICDETVGNILEQFAEDLEREEGLRKRYTAQDVRTAIQTSAYDQKTAKVLMRYAEYLERENTCKKQYEYSVYPPEVNGVFQYRAGAELKALMLKQTGISDETIVRREVGEWEEVTNEG